MEKEQKKKTTRKLYPQTSYQLTVQQGVFQCLQIHAQETASGSVLKFQQ